ncbi:MAG: hypothetical protein LC105_05345 [Chitinophagales bacterium]|nr:hypothetical protein [Chitinophagales bacterium]
MSYIVISYPTHYKQLSISDLKKQCLKDFNKKLANKKVINKVTGAKIHLSQDGAKHALYARPGGFEKIICTTAIDKIIIEAREYEFKKTEKKGDLFMMELYAKVKIDNKKFSVTVFVRGTNQGKLYYDHALII